MPHCPLPDGHFDLRVMFYAFLVLAMSVALDVGEKKKCTKDLSKATVSRMLKKAQAEEIVRTTVVSPSGTYADLETELLP